MPAVTDKHEPLPSAVFDANGNAQITYRSNNLVVIHQVTISANSTKQTFCTVTKGGSETRGNAIPTSSAIIDTTRAGNGSTASGAPAITLSPNELLAFTWTGGNAGDTATAAIHYQILEA